MSNSLTFRKSPSAILTTLESVRHLNRARAAVATTTNVYSVLPKTRGNIPTNKGFRKNLPVIVSDVLLKNHCVYIIREPKRARKSSGEAGQQDPPVDESITDDGNISDASTVIYRGDRPSPASSPELIVGI